MDRFKALGIVTNKPYPDKEKLKKLLFELNSVFEDEVTTKETIVRILKDYLPNFEHIETGKSLDSKM